LLIGAGERTRTSSQQNVCPLFNSILHQAALPELSYSGKLVSPSEVSPEQIRKNDSNEGYEQ